jgi:putative ABC transport system ATP-binding protein
VNAVGGIELELEPGTSLAVMGPSGCGKSTLLGLIAGLEVPSEGRVTIGGQEISSLGAEERARVRRDELGLVFQADNLLPFLTAVENVGLQLVLSRDRDDPSECRALLADLGLSGEYDKLPDQLSGGQRQRVAVARALVHRPRLVLADEPTGALDAGNSAVVIDALLAAQRESGATLVVVTHDADVARRLDRTIRMRDGRLDDRQTDSQS